MDTTLTEQMAAKQHEMRALLDAADGPLTEEQSTQFEQLKAQYAALERRHQSELYLAEIRAKSKPVDASPEQRDFDAMCRDFSITGAISAAIKGNKLEGRDAEVAQELERRDGSNGGIRVPLAALSKRAANVTTSTAGQLVATDHLSGDYVDLVREASILSRLGARHLTGLQGNVEIPRQTSGLTAQWIAEDAALSASGLTFDKIQLTPKTVGALTEYTRNMVLQSSPDIEGIVRADLAATIAAALDSAAIAGTGQDNQPLGILNQSGIGTSSGVLDWAAIVTQEEALASAFHTPTGWLTAPGVVKTLRTTLKSADSAAGYIMENSSTLDGMRVLQHSLAANKLILADWGQLLIGHWSSVELLANAFASGSFEKGNILVRILCTCDIAVRHPEAFHVHTVTE